MSLRSHIDSPSMSDLKSLLRRLYNESGAEKYDIDELHFEKIMTSVADKYLAAGSSESNRCAFLKGLRVEELALAQACAAGHEKAWQDFMIRYREKLHDTALRITREDSKARDLAGSIYADLYGTSSRDGQRMSKLSYYSGRGSLEGWLRTVMAQHYVNDYRSHRHTVSLEEQTEAGRQFASDPGPEGRATDPRLAASVDDALTAISAEERCILAYYFLDEMTLASVASVLQVHESTISRRLEKLVRRLRKDVILRLTRKGMSRRQAEEALETDVRDLTVDIRKQLTQDSAISPFSPKKIVSAREGQE